MQPITTTETLRSELRVLAFDLYDTLLDRESKLVPAIDGYFDAVGHDGDPVVFLRRYLAMHFRDSMIDSLIDGPHTPFKEISRRAFVYRLEQAGAPVDDDRVRGVLEAWRTLEPYPDVEPALSRLGEEYALVGLSNGDPDMLAAVSSSFETELDGTVSVAEAGAYKPHPAPYRLVCERFDVAPHEVAFVSAHTFDIVGAKAVGMRGAFVNRHDNPYGGWPHRPDVEVDDPKGLADALA
ncbi:haloacid dehalogenase type II [Halalkalicoccus ordinarius]|uniref:haloacid dehalogenase type II n=1 Tax=Halalkalicoccus ordinarius TaxID=3116651 RepID=UPI00300F468D